MKNITIIGLGYVGLPLACLIKEKGYNVHGIDIKKERIDLIKKSINPLDNSKLSVKLDVSTEPEALKQSDIIIICVPTPVDSNYLPDLEPFKNASEIVSKHLKKDQLIIIESTINPGVTEEVIKPILEKSRLKAGEDFFLAHCPERINPGDKKWNVKNISRVLGAISDKGLGKAYEFYKSILDADILKMSSVKSAEAVKIIENSFRDVNIAFVNELAKSFDKLDIDVVEVIKGASTKPFAFLSHYPGCGVGGHCIPVDPYYLIERARLNGFNHDFLKLAREINNSMPRYTVTLFIKELEKLNIDIKGCKVGVLGLSYKGGVNDIRESPSFKIIDILKKLGAQVIIYDPYVLDKSTVKNSIEFLEKSDYIILATNHPEFENLDYSKVKIVIDGRNFLDKDKIKNLGVVYKGIGR